MTVRVFRGQSLRGFQELKGPFPTPWKGGDFTGSEGPLRAAQSTGGQGHRIRSLSEGRKVHSTAPLKTTCYVAFRRFCPI